MVQKQLVLALENWRMCNCFEPFKARSWKWQCCNGVQFSGTCIKTAPLFKCNFILAQSSSQEAKRGPGDTKQAGILRVNHEVFLLIAAIGQ
jgi:hypothetical protein